MGRELWTGKLSVSEKQELKKAHATIATKTRGTSSSHKLQDHHPRLRYGLFNPKSKLKPSITEMIRSWYNFIR
jgi:hypothetical protein